MASHPLNKDQRRRLVAYLKKSKPEGWRNLLAAVNNGPPWKALGLYFECVRAGMIDDSVFFERWSVGNSMPPMPSVATQSEGGLSAFLASIKQRQLQEADSTPADPAPQPPAQKAPMPPQEPSQAVPKRSRTTSRKTKENKRTISLMIEPSLYEQVKQLAEIQDRSIGAQVRHAIRQDLERNAYLLYDSATDDDQ